jgi:hypothetical protein
LGHLQSALEESRLVNAEKSSPDLEPVSTEVESEPLLEPAPSPEFALLDDLLPLDDGEDDRESVL